MRPESPIGLQDFSRTFPDDEPAASDPLIGAWSSRHLVSTISTTFARIAIAVCCVSLIGFLLSGPVYFPPGRQQEVDSLEERPASEHVLPLYCPTSSLAKDIIVVLKTGATESWRLKSHAKTDLRCIPNYFIVSDVEEHRDGLVVHDILQNYTGDVQDHAPEFDFYRTLQEYHEAGLPINDSLATPNGERVKEDNLGWKLDKWKFMPMIQRAVKQQPTAKWYVFIEADTYLVWSNLLSFLERYDSDEPFYIGAPNSFPGIGYAHGGSGFVLSSQVATLLASYGNVHVQKVVDMTEKDCCGDSLIARVMKVLDIELIGGWPHIQGETPESQDYTSRHWCYPVVSFHHMHPNVIMEVGEFEESWLQGGNKDPITHRDIFENFVRSKLSPRRDDWDNRSSRSPPSDGDDSGSSYEACNKICKDDSTCIQFSWKPGQCRTSDWFALGSANEESSISSGYLLDRIDAYIRDLGSCKSPSWIGIDHNSEVHED